MERTRIVILGAAGRDFHNFNTVFRNDERYHVVAFTATQIPEIEGRVYPPSLAGELYPRGIPILSMDELERIVRENSARECYFSYSDVSYVDVMHVATRVLSAGAKFAIVPPSLTMLQASKPVIAVVAVRTGCGKSQTARFIARGLNDLGMRVAVIRHPMPYGDIFAQRVQKFETLEDLAEGRCTVEEREEYEHHINAGNIVFAGVDYQEVLELASKDADVLLWDGGNNDTPFVKPDILFTVTDPHRAGHERLYFPGELNFSLADVIIINKVDTAEEEDIAVIENNARQVNPKAQILHTRSPVTVDTPDMIKGNRVLCVEDGPTLTHGEMSFGAAYVAAKKYGAKEVVPPQPFAKGSIKNAYEEHPHLKDALPALGYSGRQIKELEETIASVECDVVIVGTPIDLSSIISIPQPMVRAYYSIEEVERGAIMSAVERVIHRKVSVKGHTNVG